jgi:hypothetical protein
MVSIREEFSPIKNCSMIDIQDTIAKAISDLTKSKYSCKVDNIEFMDWNKAVIKFTLDGSEEVIKNISGHKE